MIIVGNIYAGLGGSGSGVTGAESGTYIHSGMVRLGTNPLLENVLITQNAFSFGFIAAPGDGSQTTFNIASVPGNIEGDTFDAAGNEADFGIVNSGQWYINCFNTIGNVKGIDAQIGSGSGIILNDNIDNIGLVGGADYTNPSLPLQYMQRIAAGSFLAAPIVDLEGLTTAQTLFTFTPATPGTFRLNVTAGYVSGAGLMQGYYSYTDIRGNVTNVQVIGIDSGHLDANVSPLVFKAAAGDAITVISTISGVIEYDFSCTLEKLI